MVNIVCLVGRVKILVACLEGSVLSVDMGGVENMRYNSCFGFQAMIECYLIV